MKKLLPLLLLAAASAFAQKPADGVWTQFEKQTKAGSTFGYKDATGHIRIPAKFGDFSRALRFRHIVAVSEEATQRHYYLLKNGRQVGRDSVYMFDYTFDCESESKIRFESRAKNRVGFLNGQGRVVIPAVYNYVTPFHNALAVGLIGARAKCFSGEKDSIACEHPGWVGGKWVLLNERNEILINFSAEFPWQRLSLYSASINAAAPDTATTVTLRAVNGDRYSFVDYEKEFAKWFYSVFVPAVRMSAVEKITSFCLSEVMMEGPAFRDRLRLKRADFAQKFYKSLLQPELSAIRHGNESVRIFSDDLAISLLSGRQFQYFFTDCGQPFQEKYPAFTVVITKVNSRGAVKHDYQEQFAFIRTAKGYRLFSVAQTN